MTVTLNRPEAMSSAGAVLSYDAILKAHKGIGPGFDFCRLCLAALVMMVHSMELGEAASFTESGLFGLRYYIVPAFFALSGFLVWGSFLRIRDLTKFMTFRALRILPALLTEIALSALILGPLVTTAARADYFSDPLFIRYFLNVLGLVQYHLPAVFQNNHTDIVNISLRTVPSEMLCYISIAALIYLGIASTRRIMLCGFLCTLLTLQIGYFLFKGTAYNPWPLDWKMLICDFYAGAVVFSYREYIPHNPLLLLISMLVFAAGIFVCEPIMALFGPISIAYVITWLGLVKMPRIPLLMSGDYSYGIYLYGYPIQQTYFWLFPKSHWLFNFALAFFTAWVFAAFSWWFIEKPCLRLRRKLFSGTRLARMSREQDLSVLSDPGQRFDGGGRSAGKIGGR